MPKTAGANGVETQQKTGGFRTRRSGDQSAKPANSPVASVTETARPAPARSAPPLPKRNKGRLFVGTIFLSTVAIAVYFAWTTFFQYQSYGVIQGRLITVSAPWDGVVLNWQITDGELVKQGQSLAEISNLSMRHSLEALVDDLKLTQAQLEAESAKLRFEQQGLETESKKAQAEYLQSFGNLEAEEARYSDLSKRLERAKRLIKAKNFSQARYDEVYFEHIGQKRKMEQLRFAVEALKSRVELSEREQTVDRQQQIQPLLTKIDTIQSEIQRIREKIGQGRLVAPVSGRITKRLFLTGESVQLNEAIVEILEDNSTEAILFVPQQCGDDFQVGNIVEVELEPYDQNVRCEVVRLSDQFEAPPKHIERYYSANQVLLPIHLKPLPEYEQFMSFRINGMIKLPIQWKKNACGIFDNIGSSFKDLFTDNSHQYSDAVSAANNENSDRMPAVIDALTTENREMEEGDHAS